MKEPGNEVAGARTGLNKQMTQAAIWSTPAVVKASAHLINLVTREETPYFCVLMIAVSWVDRKSHAGSASRPQPIRARLAGTIELDLMLWIGEGFFYFLNPYFHSSKPCGMRVRVMSKAQYLSGTPCGSHLALPRAFGGIFKATLTHFRGLLTISLTGQQSCFELPTRLPFGDVP